MKKLIITLLFPILLIGQNQLQGKKIHFFGDSITAGIGTTNQQSYPYLVCSYFGATRVSYAVQGTTLMQQIPINPISAKNMETWATPPLTPIFNPEIDGLIFVSFLTNDVGLNLTNYTLENFGKAIDNVVNGLLNAGWSKDRIKFNVRYFITDKGLNYVGIAGVKIPATLERYNAFADLLKSKLDGYGIQYFDHWDTLSAIPDAVLKLDAAQRHPNNLMHSVIAKNIVENIKLPTLGVKTWILDDSFTDVQYFNLLGQKVLNPSKGIYILKASKNGIVYIKKIML